MDRIQGTDVDPGQLWRDGDPGAGILPTTFKKDFQNGFQEELVGIIEAAGLTPSVSDWTQIRQALAILLGPKTGKDFLVNGAFRH
mgnify:FL=1